MSAESVAEKLVASLEGISAASFDREADRVRVRDALFETLRKVQSPWDIAWEQVWVNGATNAAIKTLIDAGVFTAWAANGPDEPKTCAELAAMTGADEQLLRRLVRLLAGQHQLAEVDCDTFAQTPWSRSVGTMGCFPGCYGEFYHKLNMPIFGSLPAYLRHTDFRNPTDVDDGNFQFCRNDKSARFFTYIGANSNLISDFNDAMECHSRYNLTSWTEIYPTETVLSAAAANSKGGKPLVVDVGGGKGHDLQKFLARHEAEGIPDGSLVLQDLPEILKEGMVTSPIIKVQHHDFFTPQPADAQGARVYFMHNILHDWPNPKALEILSHLAAAMERGYSRLLIHESFVRNEKPPLRVTVSDITMMAALSAAERSEDEWRSLMADAGLKVIKIWTPSQSVESIIEAELA